MIMELEGILPENIYPFFYKYAGRNETISIKGSELILAIERFKEADLTVTHHLGAIKYELKDLHVALSRAIEEGDNLKLGIVLGQSISKLEQIIND